MCCSRLHLFTPSVISSTHGFRCNQYAAAAAAAKSLQSVRPHRRQPTRLHHPWDSPGRNTGVGCYFLLQCMKVKRESEVAQLCLTLRDPMDCSLPGSSVHGIFQARVLEWGAIAFSNQYANKSQISISSLSFSPELQVGINNCLFNISTNRHLKFHMIKTMSNFSCKPISPLVFPISVNNSHFSYC